MNASDFMVGDWVRHNGDCVTISSLSKTQRASNEGIDVRSDERGVKSKIEPIPLTATILKNNGWYQGRVYTQNNINTGTVVRRFRPYLLTQGNGRVVLTVTFNDNNEAELEFYTPAVHIKLNVCRYVHELQHALRLCGIGKEISL